ncbi:MAG: aminotransferase class III-fold pyridoxal phosphate-dependent enzyme [Desulfobacterales bacterium]|nr:aminotransferase class III-fold pyridoxal phosphate-dependent enzyme [Desulfobacterales bacterium]
MKIVWGTGLPCSVGRSTGKEYLDLVAGIAVCNLGHAHPEVVAALKEQADRLFHCLQLSTRSPAGTCWHRCFPSNSFA